MNPQQLINLPCYGDAKKQLIKSGLWVDHTDQPDESRCQSTRDFFKKEGEK